MPEFTGQIKISTNFSEYYNIKELKHDFKISFDFNKNINELILNIIALSIGQ